MVRFRLQLFELLDLAAPQSLIDVGCGEGMLTAELAARVPGPVRGVDLPDPELSSDWTLNARPDLEYLVGDAGALPGDAGEFDAASAIEVLEHLPDPEAALGEMTRVARRWLIVSVPREPAWRAANVMRGAYVRALGDTPGHVNHWSRRGFLALLEGHGSVIELRSPFPWTLALVAL